jgi:hypothetical protein
MAVPTIISLDPTTGPPCGKNLVIVNGSNFRIPTTTYTVPSTDISQTVSVTVDGVPADRVEVGSSSKLYIIIPEATMTCNSQKFSAVDIRVANLDDDGNEISGENVTLSDGYTYKRWVLGESPLIHVAKKYLERLTREIHPNVGWNVHPEFVEEVEGTVTLVTEAPSINVDVDIAADVDFIQFAQGFTAIADGSLYKMYRGLRPRRLETKLLVVGRNKLEAMHMVTAIEDTFSLNPWISVTADSEFYSGSTDKFPVELRGSPTRASNPNTMGTFVMAMNIWIRGLQLISSVPVDWYKGLVTDEMTAHLTDMDGDNRATFSV